LLEEIFLLFSDKDEISLTDERFEQLFEIIDDFLIASVNVASKRSRRDPKRSLEVS